MKTKFVLIAIIGSVVARAELTETTMDWESACDGSTIEVITDAGKIQGVRAVAGHSAVFREWTIHYLDGLPITAEYRERLRGKIKKGDRAGEDSGENPVKTLRTFRAANGIFEMDDKELASDLADVLRKATSSSEQAGSSNGG
jgi:hypothetical protein